MTKIGIQTWGSNGDIRPMMALAEGLTRQGHQVTLTVSSIATGYALCQFSKQFSVYCSAVHG